MHTPVTGGPERRPDPIDMHVGAQLRRLRRIRKVSQQSLAEALGLTFQQVQKYESGYNRISASMMYRACNHLGVSVLALYAGLPDMAGELVESAEDERIRLLALDPEARRMMLVWDRLIDEAKAAIITSAELMAAGGRG
jgi:transcriptional regulator with XRE-family HTH domain